jgi:hypothetical protein
MSAPEPPKPIFPVWLRVALYVFIMFPVVPTKRVLLDLQGSVLNNESRHRSLGGALRNSTARGAQLGSAKR